MKQKSFTERLDDFLSRLAARPGGEASGGPRRKGSPARRRRRALYYFAYGSNMNEHRAYARMPGAVVVGRAVLRDFTIRERLYADIEAAPGSTVEGVLFRVADWHLRVLDRYEGAPNVYSRIRVTVECGESAYRCWTYMMTATTCMMRSGLKFPPWYQSMCSVGARQHGVRDDFGKE